MLLESGFLPPNSCCPRFDVSSNKRDDNDAMAFECKAPDCIRRETNCAPDCAVRCNSNRENVVVEVDSSGKSPVNMKCLFFLIIHPQPSIYTEIHCQLNGHRARFLIRHVECLACRMNE